MSRDIAPFGLRMPGELKSMIEEAAKENGRSMNAEIIARIEGSFYSLSMGEIELPDATSIKAAANQIAVDSYRSAVTGLLNGRIKNKIEFALRSGRRDCLVDLSDLMEKSFGDDQKTKWRAINEIETVLKDKGYEVARQEHLDLLIKF